MKRKLELSSTKKDLIYQMCSVNLVHLLQHHICASTGKVRVKIQMSRKGIISHRDQSNTMILRCEHDVSISTIKKLFALKFQVPITSFSLFSSDSLTINDNDTISEIVLRSGGFDGISPINIIAHLNEETEQAITPVDDDMPVLEAESYESESPLPILDTQLPCSSKEQPRLSPLSMPCINQQEESISPQKFGTKRKITLDEAKPPKIKPSSPEDMTNFFNIMNASTSNNQTQNSSIFAPPMPYMMDTASYLQMMVNLPVFQQLMKANTSSSFVPNFNQLSPMAIHNLMVESRMNEFLKILQMSKTNVKKPGAKVKPMPRESVDRGEKNAQSDSYKNEPNVEGMESPILTCAKI
jgi:hypothetical protein